MKKLFLVILGLILAANSEALPVIGATSGTLNHGSTLTITGTGFGTKGVAAPLKYDDFEGGVYGNDVGNGWLIDCAGPGGTHGECNPDYSNRKLRTNSTLSARARFFGNGNTEVWESSIWLQVAPPALKHIYLDYWTQTTNINANYPDNQKLFRIHAVAGSPNLYFNIYCDDGATSHLSQDQTTDVGLFHRYFNSTPPLFRNNWRHLQGYFEQSSVATYDGTARFWVDSRNYVNDLGNWINSSTAYPGDWNRIFFGNFSQTPGSGQNCGVRDTAYIYMDNVYCDTTQAHVEIGDGNTYDACTVREIQPPTSWIDTAINVTLNRGAWSDFNGKYVYVIDRTGAVNTIGFPLTGNPPPPSSCATGGAANKITVVQTPTAFVGGNVNTGAKAFVTNLVSGNKVIVCEWNGRSGGPYSISSITTSGTATLTAFSATPATITSSTRKGEIWRADVTGSGTCTVTVNMSGNTDVSFTVTEAFGIPTIASGDLDNSSGATGTSTSANTNVITTNANTAIFATMANFEASTGLTSGAGYNLLAESEASTFMPIHSEWKAFTSTGSKVADVTLDVSHNWGIVAQAFKSIP